MSLAPFMFGLFWVRNTAKRMRGRGVYHVPLHCADFGGENLGLLASKWFVAAAGATGVRRNRGRCCATCGVRLEAHNGVRNGAEVFCAAVGTGWRGVNHIVRSRAIERDREDVGISWSAGSAGATQG